jgi:hypothetical protein
MPLKPESPSGIREPVLSTLRLSPPLSTLRRFVVFKSWYVCSGLILRTL